MGQVALAMQVGLSLGNPATAVAHGLAGRGKETVVSGSYREEVMSGAVDVKRDVVAPCLTNLNMRNLCHGTARFGGLRAWVGGGTGVRGGYR
jgi:hypothetical protein